MSCLGLSGTCERVEEEKREKGDPEILVLATPLPPALLWLLVPSHATLGKGVAYPGLQVVEVVVVGLKEVSVSPFKCFQERCLMTDQRKSSSAPSSSPPAVRTPLGFALASSALSSTEAKGPRETEGAQVPLHCEGGAREPEQFAGELSLSPAEWACDVFPQPRRP